MSPLQLLLVVVLIVLTNAATPQYFIQQVDHFDTQNTDTYLQKYYTYVEGKSSDSPVFFFLGGEAPVEFFEFQEVSAWNWAKDFGAWYFSLEHRFYGTSNPKPDLSLDSLRYLSSQQALADAANFILKMKTNYTGPWIVFGCSYSGALSAWFRAKYPSLVIGSVAPSGPVLAINSFTEFFHNFQQVADSECVSATQAAVAQVEQMLQQPNGLSQLSSYFYSCTPLSTNDITYFKWTITEFLTSAAQWQNPPGWDLTYACGNLTQNSNYAKNWGYAMYVANENQCTNFTLASFINPMKTTAVNNDGRSWFYQKCTEFGFFQTAYPNSSIFFDDIPVEFVNHCKEVFGVEMTPDVDWTNAYYGGMDLEATNVLFTNGLYDPWHRLSIIKPQNGISAVVYEAGHCAPMTLPTSQDPPSLVQARQAVQQFLQNLLKKQ